MYRMCLFLLLSALVTCDAAQLRFTAIPDQDVATLEARADAVSAYLENYLSAKCVTEVNVTYSPVTDYQSAIDALLAGTADFGWYGGLTGVQAGLRSPPSVYLAQRIEDQQFTSVFIQGADVGLLMGIEGANNKSLAFGSASSTSGHLMPQYYLTEAAVVPSSTIFTGSHDATVDAVVAGTTQVGALNSVVWENRIAANTTGGTSVFYTTPEYVDYLWVAGAGIVEAWADIEGAPALADGCGDINTLLKEAFLAASADEPLGEALFNAYSTKGFVSITPGEYDPIEETGCSLGMIEEQFCSNPPPANLGNVATNGTATNGTATNGTANNGTANNGTASSGGEDGEDGNGEDGNGEDGADGVDGVTTRQDNSFSTNGDTSGARKHPIMFLLSGTISLAVLFNMI